MAESDRPTSPPGFHWNWREFAFATLSNTAGTLLAVWLVYLGGIAGGYFRANPYYVVGGALFMLGFLLIASGVRLMIMVGRQIIQAVRELTRK